MATQQRWEDFQHELWELVIAERKAELDERKALLRLLIGITIAAMAVAALGALSGHVLAGLGSSGVLSTTALVFTGRRRRRAAAAKDWAVAEGEFAHRTSVGTAER